MPPIDPADDEHYVFTRSELQLVRRVVLDEQPTGLVYLRSDLAQVTSRLKSNLTILGVVLTASFLAAFFVSRATQRAIAQPLVELAETARRASPETTTKWLCSSWRSTTCWTRSSATNGA